jgi:hypothetical protein
MSARQTILKLAVIFLVGGGIGIPAVDAAVYKWKDENGITHFTDDITQVPEAFWNKPLIKDDKTATPNATKIIAPDAEETTPHKKTIINKPAEIEKNASDEGLTEEQRSSAEIAVNFLREDIVRYDKFKTWPPSRSKFRAIKLAVAGATPQKQALRDQISKLDLPLFQEIAGFLQSSIAEDEKAQKIYPTTLPSARQIHALMNRLKNETGQENQLLEKLTALLNFKK